LQVNHSCRENASFFCVGGTMRAAVNAPRS
jgi:hypothetical protein